MMILGKTTNIPTCIPMQGLSPMYTYSMLWNMCRFLYHIEQWYSPVTHFFSIGKVVFHCIVACCMVLYLARWEFQALSDFSDAVCTFRSLPSCSRQNSSSLPFFFTLAHSFPHSYRGRCTIPKLVEMSQFQKILVT